MRYMPRKPSNPHPLRTARNILGFSQTEFAASVGTSAVNIQQIENGVTKMSPGLARRISLIYNLDPKQLMSGDDPDHPRLVFGHKAPLFTKEYAERLHRTVDPEERRLRRETLLFTLDLLFDAAEDKGRYQAFLYDLTDGLKKRAEEFNLIEPAIQKLGEYGAYPGHPEATQMIWDMLFSAGFIEVKSFVETREKLRNEPKPEPAEPQSSAKGTIPNKP
jgi:transcriptional regulator with XRE-family HTH domain